MELLEDAFINEGIEESHLIGAVVEDVLNTKLDAPLNQIHIVIEIGEGNFRLDHPELTRVARGVALFGAEGRAKGVDVLERHRKSLDMRPETNAIKGSYVAGTTAEGYKTFVGTYTLDKAYSYVRLYNDSSSVEGQSRATTALSITFNPAIA